MALDWTYLAALPFLYILITHLLHVFYFAGGRCKSRASLAGKTVIVTGANSGIGKYTAMGLAARGARVILACRNQKKTLPVIDEIKAKTKNPNVVFMELDLSSFKSVQKFTDAFLSTEERLDVLINNAGMMSLAGTTPELNENGIEITIMVNYLGPFLLTKNLLDIMKKSGPGSRVVSVADSAHDAANPNAFKNLKDNLKIDGFANYEVLPRPRFIPRAIDLVWPFFESIITTPGGVRHSNSKLAIILFSNELGKRLAGTGVRAYSLHPGGMMTEIGIDRKTGEDVYGFDRHNAFMRMTEKLPYFIQPLTFPLKTLEEGAQTSIYCAVSEEVADDSGMYYADCAVGQVDRAELNDQFTAKFWEWSEEVVHEAHQI